MKKLIYLSGLYSSNTKGTKASYEEINENIALAKKYAKKVWEAGAACLCPHMNGNFNGDDLMIDYADFIEGDLRMLYMCDAVFMLPNWKKSPGAKVEKKFALDNNILVFTYFKNVKAFIRKNIKECSITRKFDPYAYKINNKIICGTIRDKVLNFKNEVEQACIDTYRKTFVGVPRL